MPTHELTIGQAVVQCGSPSEVRGWLSRLAKVARNLSDVVRVENLATGRTFSPGTLADCVALGLA